MSEKLLRKRARKKHSFFLPGGYVGGRSEPCALSSGLRGTQGGHADILNFLEINHPTMRCGSTPKVAQGALPRGIRKFPTLNVNSMEAEKEHITRVSWYEG